MNWSDALNLLPDHEPRLDAWEQFDHDPRLADLRADSALDLFLRHLPDHEPATNLWDRLDAELSTDDTLDRALTALPQFEPRADLWESLADELALTNVPETTEPVQAQPSPTRTHSPFTVVRPTGFGQGWGRWAAAASVVLGLLGGYWLLQRVNISGETITVAYSVETTDVGPLTEANLPGDQQADQDLEEYINQACEQQALACKRPEVQDLRQQLADLNQRKTQIDKQLSVFGEDPDLVRAQVRIENERADVVKELVNKLNI